MLLTKGKEKENEEMKKWICAMLALLCVLSLGACSKKEEKKEVSLSEIHQAVKDAYGEAYYIDMALDAATLDTMMGLKEDMYEEVIAEGPMINAQVDMFIAVKAAEGKADDVEKVLNDYRDYQINDAFQYPANMVKVQASEVVRHGDYVFFVLLGEIPFEAEEQGDDAILEAAKKGVKIGVDTINGFFE